MYNKLRLKYNFDEKFLSRVRVTDTGHVVAGTEDKKGIIALGCKFCITNKVGQDDMGYPTIGGIRMLYFGDIYRITDIDEAVKANTWLCPECRIPMRIIYPEFGVRSK